MSSASGDDRQVQAPVEPDDAVRLVEQREEQLTATDWFFSHAVRMRAAYRPEPVTPGDESEGDPVTEDDRT